MAVVYHAEDMTLKRRVALKLFPHRMKIGQRTILLEQFIREARSVASLDHPNIVRVHEVGRDQGWFYIAMELLEGCNLDELVSSAGPLDHIRACQLTADAADALAYAHPLGVIHRDIKPANLVLTRTGRCCITDFGLALILSPDEVLELPSPSVGTPYYMAPELARGRSADERSDIYSLGATLWHLVTGRPPFTASSPRELLMKHISEPLPDIRKSAPQAPSDLRIALEQALAKDPNDRFQSATQFARVLRRLTIPRPEEPLDNAASAMESMIALQASLPSIDRPRHLLAPRVHPTHSWSKPATWLAGAGALIAMAALVLAIRTSMRTVAIPPMTPSTAMIAALSPADDTGAEQTSPLTDAVTAPDDAPQEQPGHAESIEAAVATEPTPAPSAAAVAESDPKRIPSAPHDNLATPDAVVSSADSTAKVEPSEPQTANTLESTPAPEELSPTLSPPTAAPQAPPLPSPKALGVSRVVSVDDMDAILNIMHSGSQELIGVFGEVAGAGLTSTGRSYRIRFKSSVGVSAFYAVAFPRLYTALENTFGQDGSRLAGQYITVRGRIGAYRGEPQIILDSVDQIIVIHP
jgi:serine/threonine protein kinase